MNGYLEMKVSDLRQTWDNYMSAKEEIGVYYKEMKSAYEEEFGHPFVFNSGLGGHELTKELGKAKANRNRELGDDGFWVLLRMPVCFDPPLKVKEQRRAIETILAASENEDAKVVVDIDLCDFIRRWKTGGSFLK